MRKVGRFCFFSIFYFVVSTLHGQSATEIMQRADEKMRGKTSIAQMTFQTIRPTWSREMKVQLWISGTDKALLLVQSPVKEKGVAFLKRKKEVWNWLPSLEKLIKLPPSMMSQSWMGTDFTNDDLVRESSVVQDYTHRFLSDSIVNGSLCYQIECIPKPETAVVWGRLQVFIDQKDLIELFIRFYDEEGMLINTLHSYDLQRMDGRLIPARIEMIPADKKGQKTVILYQSVLFDRIIDEKWFSLDNLKKIH